MTFSSAEYWERRYGCGSHSGAGSYGRLAEFKAEVLNRFVLEHGIRDVIDFGCGDGAQLSLAKYPHYVGIDVSATAVDKCRARFQHDTSKRFYLPAELPAPRGFELALSLDVIFHLVEDDVFTHYMAGLFRASHRYVIVYSTNRNAVLAEHVRDRQFTTWVEVQQPDWDLIQHIPSRYPWDVMDRHNTSPAEFFIYKRPR
ncbi:MAG: class I SAM-dependent methyltransferase [Chthoniobacterales bacterium]|nr:class I SAM-dependent methyltransferase [Chthoniobacterales bacterium]